MIHGFTGGRPASAWFIVIVAALIRESRPLVQPTFLAAIRAL
jgi:hypothetical protein